MVPYLQNIFSNIYKHNIPPLVENKVNTESEISRKKQKIQYDGEWARNMWNQEGTFHNCTNHSLQYLWYIRGGIKVKEIAWNNS